MKISGLKIPKLVRWIFLTGIIFLLLMSLLRLTLFLYFPRQGNSLGDMGAAFMLGCRFDLREISITCALLLIIGCIPGLDPFRTRAGQRLAYLVTGLASLLLVLFYTVDFAHYSYLSQRLNASVLNYLSDASISAGMVWQSYPVLRIVLLLIAGTWLISRVIWRVFGRIRANGQPVGNKSRVGWGLAAGLLFAFGIFGRAGQFPLRWSDAFSLGSDYKANMALNPFQSFFSSLKFAGLTYDRDNVKRSYSLLMPYFGFDISGKAHLNYVRDIPAAKSKNENPPNVVVVICESFSAYKSSMWGNPLNTTPFFDSLCRRGIFFDHCFTPSYGTARGVWALITGIPDVESAKSTSSRNPAAVNQHTILNNFNGYAKYYFIGGSASWANIRGLLNNNIVDLKLYEGKDYDAPKLDVWGISDKNLFLEASQRLSLENKPFFAIIQTADNHRPYSIPEEDRVAFRSVTVPPDSLRKFGFESNDELNAFRYTDFGYRAFIEAASRQKYFDNTIFVFIGDHGIPGDAGDMFPKAWTDQKLTSEHVPLLLFAPKLLEARRISNLCSQVDVLPTLAGACSLGYQNTTLGRDILDTLSYADKAFSFIYNPDEGYIGVIKGDYFYRRQISGAKEEIVSVVGNGPVPDAERARAKSQLRGLTEAFYETAKYMLLNNKK